MKTQNCIIQLTFVPASIEESSNGFIKTGMFLQRDAVDSLLRGNMFSGLDCMWGCAGLVTNEDAEQAIMQLDNFGMNAMIITIF